VTSIRAPVTGRPAIGPIRSGAWCVRTPSFGKQCSTGIGQRGIEPAGVLRVGRTLHEATVFQAPDESGEPA